MSASGAARLLRHRRRRRCATEAPQDRRIARHSGAPFCHQTRCRCACHPRGERRASYRRLVVAQDRDFLALDASPRRAMRVPSGENLLFNFCHWHNSDLSRCLLFRRFRGNSRHQARPLIIRVAPITSTRPGRSGLPSCNCRQALTRLACRVPSIARDRIGLRPAGFCGASVATGAKDGMQIDRLAGRR